MSPSLRESAVERLMGDLHDEGGPPEAIIVYEAARKIVALYIPDIQREACEACHKPGGCAHNPKPRSEVGTTGEAASTPNQPSRALCPSLREQLLEMLGRHKFMSDMQGVWPHEYGGTGYADGVHRDDCRGCELESLVALSQQSEKP